MSRGLGQRASGRSGIALPDMIPFQTDLIPAKGPNLTDANVTLQVFTAKKSLYVMPAGTLSTNRVVTMGIAGPIQSMIVFILCLDTSANTLTIKNNAGTTLFTHQGSVTGPQWYEVFFTAADWVASTRQYAAAQ